MSTKRPRKPTPNEQEWEKQIRRLQRLIKQTEREGYTFIRSPLPEEKPRRITKQTIKELQSIKLKQLKTEEYTTRQTVDKIEQTPTTKTKIPRFTPETPQTTSPRTTTPTAPSPKTPKPRTTKSKEPKQPLSDEERKRIRSQAAKKAQQTIKRKMAENPEYRARREEQYRKAGQRLQEWRKKLEETGIKIEPQPNPPYDDKIPPKGELPNDTDDIVAGLIDRLNMSNNRATATYLLDLLFEGLALIADEAEEMGMTAEQLFAKNVGRMKTAMLEAADAMVYESKDDVVRSNAETLAHLIISASDTKHDMYDIAEDIERRARNDYSEIVQSYRYDPYDIK